MHRYAADREVANPFKDLESLKPWLATGDQSGGK
jgi:hypothetical protein